MPTRQHLQKLVERVRFLPALPAAFVHPCDGESLQLALAGAFAGYLAPTLVGPEPRIRDAAAKAGLDISRLPIVATADDPAASAETATRMARDGRARALVKGALSDGTLLAPVAAPDTGSSAQRSPDRRAISDGYQLAGSSGTVIGRTSWRTPSTSCRYQIG